MLKVKQAYYRVISFMVAWMVLLSGIIPTLSIIVNAEDTEPIVTQTQSQTIENFRVSFVSGADNVGTEADPNYVWTPSAPDKGHRFKYQIDYDLSGEGELPPNTVQMTIPKHIIKDRDGNYADICELSLMESSAIVEPDTEHIFVYEERNNDYLIYNRVEISAASKGTIQYGYDTSKDTFQYTDMTISDTGLAMMDIYKSESERLHTNSNMPPVTINTTASIESTYKSQPNYYSSWKNEWGSSTNFGIDNPEDYTYLVWTIACYVNATQPYTISFLDTIQFSTFGEVSVVGYKMDTATQFSAVRTSGVQFQTGYYYGYVLTKQPKTLYNADEFYSITNTVTAVVTPNDGLDESTDGNAKAIYNHLKLVPYEPPVLPIRFFEFEKSGHHSIANYDLDKFAQHEIDSIQNNMDFIVGMEASLYGETLLGTDISNIENYGKKPLTYVITDDTFYFYDRIANSNIPEGTEQLDCNDFEITNIKYELDLRGGYWDSQRSLWRAIEPI